MCICLHMCTHAYIQIYKCVYICACMCLCGIYVCLHRYVHKYLGMHMHVASKDQHQVSSSVTFHILLLETGSVMERGLHPLSFPGRDPGVSPPVPALGLQLHTTASGFHLGIGGSYSGLLLGTSDKSSDSNCPTGCFYLLSLACYATFRREPHSEINTIRRVLR